MKLPRRIACLMTVLAITILSEVYSSAELLLGHSGSNDPVNEGWSGGQNVENQNGVVTVGPESVGAQAEEAWCLLDRSNTGYAIYAVQHSPISSIEPWELSARLTLAAAPGHTSTEGIDFYLGNGLTTWGFTVWIDPDLNLVASLYGTVSAPANVLSNSSELNGFHDYTLHFDPRTSSSSLWIDGVQRQSDAKGNQNGVGFSAWGWATSYYDQADACISSVSYEIVPEPQPSLLLGLGLPWILACLRVKRST